MSWRRAALGVAVALACVGIGGCAGGGSAPTAPAKHRRAGGRIPASLRAGERPIGRGRRFHPPATGPVQGRCSPRLGAREQAHVELFGANRVVLIAAGIGTRAPRRTIAGRIVRARCFGALVTLDPTGTVYVRRGTRMTVGELFRSWGQRLSDTRIGAFTGGRVRVYVDGRRRVGPPGAVVLREGAEIVLEVGPRVPPHRRFAFPQLPPAAMR